MADGLLLAYTDPGPVPENEFNDWYDSEHAPARLTVPGISAACRFRALDGLAPPWLACYEVKAGALDSPEYKSLADKASARERSVLSRLAVLDRRAYEQISEDGEAPGGPPPAVLAVSVSVPPAMTDDLAAWYAEEHIPLLLAVPGWRRIRRFRLTRGTGPAFLALHELAGPEVFDEPDYRAAVATPWRDRIMAAALARERRLFGLHKSFTLLPRRGLRPLRPPANHAMAARRYGHQAPGQVPPLRSLRRRGGYCRPGRWCWWHRGSGGLRPARSA